MDKLTNKDITDEISSGELRKKVAKNLGLRPLREYPCAKAGCDHKYKSFKDVQTHYLKDHGEKISQRIYEAMCLKNESIGTLSINTEPVGVLKDISMRLYTRKGGGLTIPADPGEDVYYLDAGRLKKASWRWDISGMTTDLQVSVVEQADFMLSTGCHRVGSKIALMNSSVVSEYDVFTVIDSKVSQVGTVHSTHWSEIKLILSLK